MKKFAILFICCFCGVLAYTASDFPAMSEFMAGKGYVGNWIDGIQWSPDGRGFYFYCQDNEIKEIYHYALASGLVRKMADSELDNLPISLGNEGFHGRRESAAPQLAGWLLYDKQGDLFLYHTQTGQVKQITQTAADESAVAFGQTPMQIYYQLDDNLFFMDRTSGSIKQLTFFAKADAQPGSAPKGGPQNDPVKSYYEKQAKALFKDFAADLAKPQVDPKNPRIEMELKPGQRLDRFHLFASAQAVAFALITYKPRGQSTLIPHFVTASGYTENSPSRGKAAEEFLYASDLYIAKLKTNQIIPIKIPLTEVTCAILDSRLDGEQIVIVARHPDKKTVTLLTASLQNPQAKVIHTISDPGWIGDLTLSWHGWLDDNWFYFTSEETGYCHLFKINLQSGEQRQLTSGNFVVSEVLLSPDKKYLYFSANIEHPGKLNLYRISSAGSKPEHLTQLDGQNQAIPSPDFKTLAVMHSKTNLPWELHIIKPGKPAIKVKDFTSPSFKNMSWIEPEIVSFKSSDGQVDVFARVFVPQAPHPERPGVIFIHGAGYLQNAHYGWSDYFREYMFHNLLARLGYHVIDVDYSGSANYGAAFRTRIKGHMGGKDLDDIVSAATYLRQKHGVKKVGLYGGSYGGFLTLMGMFNRADQFTAGAALRSVTDWAHYSNWYTGNILGNPLREAEAYQKSSPIYFAQGLQGHLLMCHGMVDDNVHFQDIVRLSQRLIELGKKNWELAVYPLESHSFERPSSWTDEYGRILELFEKTLKTP